MLWYKSWLETRSRFLIGLALLMCSGAAAVFAYPRVLEVLKSMPAIETGGELGRRIREAAELSQQYRGYVWSTWFGQNLIQFWTIFAVLLGTGGLLSQMSGGGALFTLSLPVSRARHLAVRGGIGLVELLVLALVPSLLVTLLSPAVGQSYSAGDALAHALCLFVGGSVFFSLAALLSSVFVDVWRPLLIALGSAALLAIGEQFVDVLSERGLIATMSGEKYFRGGGLPWGGLLISAALSTAMLYAAARNLTRRDF